MGKVVTREMDAEAPKTQRCSACTRKITITTAFQCRSPWPAPSSSRLAPHGATPAARMPGVSSVFARMCYVLPSIATLIHSLNSMIQRPGKIVCIGRNYGAHAAELGNSVPQEPLLFFKPPSSVIGHGDLVKLPEASGQVELAEV